jgi:hypothetical protein
VAVPLLLTAAVVALKTAEEAAAATVTEAGTVSLELEFDSVTTAPPLGAGWVKVTVQVLEEFDPKLFGLQASDDIRMGATKFTIAWAELLL